MKHSAGIIPYKFEEGAIKFFVGHPGGPINARSNKWALLKGTVEEGEKLEDTAIREFQEESGLKLDAEDTLSKMWLVGSVTQTNNKIVTAYAMEVDDIDASKCHSNLVDGEAFPEMDRYAWMTIEEVRKACTRTNVWFYNEIVQRLGLDEDNQGQGTNI